MTKGEKTLPVIRKDELPGEKYCKHHKRLREIELQGPYWINKMI